MTIEDYAWSTHGVEEWTTRFVEAGAIELDFKFPTGVEESSQDGPRFLDDYIWPRTRATYRSNAHPDYFVFGGIVLAR